MPGVPGDDVALHRAADQRQVPDDVEDLVAHELVLEPEGAVQDPLLAHHDGVVQGPAEREALLPEQLEVLQEAVRPRGGELLDEDPLGRHERRDLHAHRRMLVVERVADAELGRRQELDPAVLVADPDRLEHSERRPAHRHLGVTARRVQERHERRRASVHRGQLGPVQLDEEIVDPESADRRQEVLDRLDLHAVGADRGRVVPVDERLGADRDRERARARRRRPRRGPAGRGGASSSPAPRCGAPLPRTSPASESSAGVPSVGDPPWSRAWRRASGVPSASIWAADPLSTLELQPTESEPVPRHHSPEDCRTVSP